MSQRKVQKAETVVENTKGEDAWKVPQKKAKLIRLERKMQKGGVTGHGPSATPSKSLEEFLLEQSTTLAAHQLNVKLVNTSSSEFDETLEESSKLYAKYQMTIHKDKEDECTLEQFKRFLVKSPLQV